MKTVQLWYFILAIVCLLIVIYSVVKDNDHGVVTGTIGAYGNLILSRLHKKD